MRRFAVILPAAGAGRRLGEALSGRGKAELELAGRPMWAWAAQAFAGRAEVVQVLVAVRPGGVAAFRERHAAEVAGLGVEVVEGGRAERWETVLRALERVSNEATHLAVHDAARPLVSAALIDRCFEALREHDAVVPGVPVTDTLKRVEGGRVVSTPERRGLVAVQTPQCFEASLLRRAYAKLAGGECDASAVTDDASLVEAVGEPVWVVEGERLNLKVTLPGDVAVAEAMLRGRRRGIGHRDTQARRGAQRKPRSEE